MIEYIPGDDLFCQHMDIVKKLKGQNDAYKDLFSKVYKSYQPVNVMWRFLIYYRLKKSGIYTCGLSNLLKVRKAIVMTWYSDFCDNY